MLNRLRCASSSANGNRDETKKRRCEDEKRQRERGERREERGKETIVHSVEFLLDRVEKGLLAFHLHLATFDLDQKFSVSNKKHSIPRDQILSVREKTVGLLFLLIKESLRIESNRIESNHVLLSRSDQPKEREREKGEWIVLVNFCSVHSSSVCLRGKRRGKSEPR